MRLENEKKLMDAHVEDLKSKLKDTQVFLFFIYEFFVMKVRISDYRTMTSCFCYLSNLS